MNPLEGNKSMYDDFEIWQKCFEAAKKNNDARLHVQTIAMSMFLCRQCGRCCAKQKRITVRRSEYNVILNDHGQHLAIYFKFDPSTREYYLDGPCPFLKYDEGRSRCSIHMSRPMVCHTYPFLSGNLMQSAKDMEGDGIVLITDPCPASLISAYKASLFVEVKIMEEDGKLDQNISQAFQDELKSLQG